MTNTAYDYSAYPISDSHPSAAGGQKAAAELVPLLNVFYNRFAGPPPIFADGFESGGATRWSSSVP